MRIVSNIVNNPKLTRKDVFPSFPSLSYFNSKYAPWLFEDRKGTEKEITQSN